MESKSEDDFNIVKHEKENLAKINLVKGVEEINRLKRENRYFDNSISSELYNKVTEVVDDLTERFEDTELNNDNIISIADNQNRNKGMNLKKKLVENLMQIREDSIKMSKNFF